MIPPRSDDGETITNYNLVDFRDGNFLHRAKRKLKSAKLQVNYFTIAHSHGGAQALTHADETSHKTGRH